ncbi:MAG: DUF1501 domain-containing protein [Acidobacteriota bacterium]
MSQTTRREFIRKSAGAVAAGVALPVLNRQAYSVTVVESLRQPLLAENRVLVIVELGGGNDPLNTFVPLQQYDIYKSFRSRLAIPKEQVLPLYGTATRGLSPNLSALKPVADAARVAVIQAVHYPQANLSHEISRTIYRVGDTNLTPTGQSGWIGRHSALFGSQDNPLDTVGIGGVNTVLQAVGAKISGISADQQGNPSGYAFNGDQRFPADRANQLEAARLLAGGNASRYYTSLAKAVESDGFNSADAVAQAAAAYTSGVTYPTTAFAGGLKLISRLASSASPALGTRVFYISLGGFDTHANQDRDHPNLLKQVGEGLKAFYDDLVAHNLVERVLVMVWSEFGRRLADNASNGTDHGEANDLMFIGGKVKGGVYGDDPSLTDLRAGNLKYKIDFREVYASVIQGWFGNSAAETAQVLNGNYNTIGFLE